MTSRSETVVIEGVVKRDATPFKRGVVVFLSPWWHGPAHFVDALLRVRIRGEDAVSERLRKGTEVRIACANLEAPRSGASWWGATGSSPELQPAAGVLVSPPAGPSPVLDVPLATDAAVPVPSSGRATVLDRLLGRTPLATDATVPVLNPARVTVLDRLLGRLTLQRGANAFRGTRKFKRRYMYELLIERSATADDRSADQRDVERARAVVRMLELEFARIRDEVAARALVMYHARWRGSRPRLSREKVIARIGLSSASVACDGGLKLSFSEGDLFFGHWIEVSLGSGLRVETVEVAGVQKDSS